MAEKQTKFATGSFTASLASQQTQSEQDITFDLSVFGLGGHEAVIGFNNTDDETAQINAIDKLIRAFIRTYF